MSRHKSKKPASDREKQELISRILLETTVESDEVVAKRHNISRRTIQRYREQLRNVANDTGLAQVVREKEPKWTTAEPPKLTMSQDLASSLFFEQLARGILKTPTWFTQSLAR